MIASAIYGVSRYSRIITNIDLAMLLGHLLLGNLAIKLLQKLFSNLPDLGILRDKFLATVRVTARTISPSHHKKIDGIVSTHQLVCLPSRPVVEIDLFRQQNFAILKKHRRFDGICFRCRSFYL